MSETAAERRAALEAELAQIEAQEAAAAEARRREAEEARRQTLAPELQQEAQLWEQQAEEALDREFPPPWQPHKTSEHPKQLVGKVLRINPRVGPSPVYGTYSAAIEVVTTQQQEWTIWCSETGALFSQLVRLRLQPGDMVAVRYRGKKQSTTSSYSYHDYRLVRLGDEQQGSFVDYDQLAREREMPQLPPASEPAAADDDIPF